MSRNYGTVFSRLFRDPFILRHFSTGNIVSVPELRTLLQAHVAALRDIKPSGTPDFHNLAPRTPSDSRARAVLPLRSDPALKEKYHNFLGNVRFGKLLEDLDTFAVWLGYRHNQTGSLMGQLPIHHPMAIVTACVDQITLAPKLIKADCDIVFEGEVSWAGRTSMECTIRLFREMTSGADDWHEKLLEAKFVMVAKDPFAPKAVPVHPLWVNTPEEESAFQRGEQCKRERLLQMQQSLLKTPPTAAEIALLHDLFVHTLDPKIHSFRHRCLPEHHVWMEDCKLKNVIICFPQQRNLYNKIFGGFLMRTAFELAWANASSFSRSHAITLAVDDIMFRKSVDVGCLLYLSSELCYTNGNQMQVRVHAEVGHVEDGSMDTTNTFYFTFLSGNGAPVPKVMPKSYGDGMLYIAGKRHYDGTAAGTSAYS